MNEKIKQYVKERNVYKYQREVDSWSLTRLRGFVDYN